MLPLLLLGVVVIILAVGGAMLVNRLVANTDARYHALHERIQRIESRIDDDAIAVKVRKLIREEGEPRA